MDVWKNCIPGDLLQLNIKPQLLSDVDKLQPELLTVNAFRIEQPEYTL